MENQHPHTYNYLYSLLEKDFSMCFEYLTGEQKQNILELFITEANDEALDAINSSEAFMSKDLAFNLINLNESNLLETRKLIAQHLWDKASYYIKRIFEHAQENHEEELNSDSDYIEHLRADNSERSAHLNHLNYSNQMINSIFKL